MLEKLLCLGLLLSSPISVSAATDAHYKDVIKFDYHQYATISNNGFSYTIYADPDVSSEIHPIDERSSEKVVLLTFDDAPRHPDGDALKIAERLNAKGVGGLFLVNGKFLYDDEGKSILKKIYDLGFEIGNHTTYHQNLRELSYKEQYEEIAETNRLIEEITGFKPRWFRPPFGKFNMDTILICNELGLQLMTWSFGYDWMDEYQDANKLAEISVNNEYLRSGANILMHDLPWTADAIDRIVDGYHAKGFHIVDPYLIQYQVNSTAPLQN